jgi:pimeloyl-ACP methyl ester carboxylesterase
MNRRATFPIRTDDEVSCTVSASMIPNVHTAAIFVHGFKGDAEDTWKSFQRLMYEDSEFDSWDAFYIGYASDREQIGETAFNLAGFVRALYPSPPEKWFLKQLPQKGSVVTEPIRLRLDETKYERLVLIGHSQGGVVIRQMVYNEARDAEASNREVCEGLCQADIALFAPALFGILLSGWMGMVGETSVWKLASAVLSSSPSFKQMQPKKSPFLANLKRDTEELAVKTADRYRSLGARIAWSRRDKVVESGDRYACDPPFTFFGRGHKFICKPTDRYEEPINFIRESGGVT